MSIKKFIRNSLINLYCYLGIAYLYRNYVKRKGSLVRVLCFHDVRDAHWFEEVISQLHSLYHVISPTDFFDKNFSTSKINVLVTFDDGYASWTHICAPILAQKNIQALFFINSGLLDAFDSVEAQKKYVSDNLLLTARETLSWEGLTTLKMQGHTIGGHTTTHARLSKLQESMQQFEIQEDKNRTEIMLSDTINAFAYPFGRKTDFTETTKTIVKDVGYTHAFTTESAFMSPVGDIYAIPRLCLEENMTNIQLKKWVGGGYDIHSFLKKLCAQ